MIIKKMSASFGRLQNETLKLEDGLNIVIGSNESGKSTWCSFIRAMLYGVNTAERDRDGHIADKTRFRPWDGAPMEGSMDIVAAGQDITLQRLSKGQNGAMKQFSAVYTGTSEPVNELMGDDAGEKLTGAAEKVFERSAFIGQAGVAVGQTAELEKRIASLVSSGEEEISYSEAEATLKKWLNKRKHNSSGLLPKLDGQLADVDARLAHMEETSAAYAEMKDNIEKFTALRKEFKDEEKLYERKERADGRALLSEASDKCRELTGQIETLRAELSESGEMPPRCEAEKGRELDNRYRAALSREESDSKHLADCEEALKEAEEKKNASVFAGKTVEEANAEISGMEYSESQSMRGVVIRRVLFAVLAAAAAVGFFVIPGGIAVKIACAVVFAAAIAAMIPGKHKTAERNDLPSQSVKELREKLSEYETVCALYDRCASDVQEATLEADAAKSARKEAEAALVSQAKLYSSKVCEPDKAAEILEKACGKYASLEALEPNLAAAQKFYAALATKDYGNEVERPENVPTPKYSKAEVASGIKYAEKELANAKTTFAAAQGELKALGDPMLLTTERESLLEQRAQLQEEYDALAMALDVLAEADSEIKTKFAPMLSEKAAEIMETLTGGKYDKLVFDKDLAASAGEKDSAVTHSAQYLSAGTTDQLYLALRLAICELMLDRDEEPCPMILDDALVSFDDERMKAAMDLLIEQAKKRQIIFFTCQTREALYCVKNKAVNIIEM